MLLGILYFGGGNNYFHDKTDKIVQTTYDSDPTTYAVQFKVHWKSTDCSDKVEDENDNPLKGVLTVMTVEDENRNVLWSNWVVVVKPGESWLDYSER